MRLSAWSRGVCTACSKAAGSSRAGVAGRGSCDGRPGGVWSRRTLQERLGASGGVTEPLGWCDLGVAGPGEAAGPRAFRALAAAM